MSAPMPPPAVDCHAHVFSADAPAVADARYRPTYAATLDDWRAQWARVGITHGVLVQPSFFGTDNRELVAALRASPDTLRGVAVIAPAIGAGELAALDAAGVRAMRLNLRGAGDLGAFAEPEWRALFDRVADLGWHVEAFVEPGRAPELAQVLLPTSIDVVFDHFGNPAADDAARATFAALAELAQERRVWVKLSGPYRLVHRDAAALAQRWIETLGADHVVWGSDWPWTRHEEGRDYAHLRAELDRWAGAERARDILWDNAARLYGFD
jgi:predicted TIM-barrel fold metal-dependent hydrolase